MIPKHVPPYPCFPPPPAPPPFPTLTPEPPARQSDLAALEQRAIERENAIASRIPTGGFASAADLAAGIDNARTALDAALASLRAQQESAARELANLGERLDAVETPSGSDAVVTAAHLANINASIMAWSNKVVALESAVNSLSTKLATVRAEVEVGALAPAEGSDEGSDEGTAHAALGAVVRSLVQEQAGALVAEALAIAKAASTMVQTRTTGSAPQYALLLGSDGRARVHRIVEQNGARLISENEVPGLSPLAVEGGSAPTLESPDGNATLAVGNTGAAVVARRTFGAASLTFPSVVEIHPNGGGAAVFVSTIGQTIEFNHTAVSYGYRFLFSDADATNAPPDWNGEGEYFNEEMAKTWYLRSRDAGDGYQYELIYKGGPTFLVANWDSAAPTLVPDNIEGIPGHESQEYYSQYWWSGGEPSMTRAAGTTERSNLATEAALAALAARVAALEAAAGA